MSKLRLMFLFGTRPEAIKLAPLLIQTKKRHHDFDSVVVVTGQHRQMLDDVLGAFGIKPDVDLNLMTPQQTLFSLTSRIFSSLEPVMDQFQPDIVVVQGDTTSTFAGALAGYYSRKKIAYVEAGLRTGNKWAPFPEEIYRKAASTMADYLFAPTLKAKENLLKEGYPDSSISITGNTVIDALSFMKERIKGLPCPVPDLASRMERGEKMILITGHRRENFGQPFQRICRTFKKLALSYPQACFVYPVHLNPHVQSTVRENLAGLPNFFLLPPLPYPDFVWLMYHCYLIITDSGGIQEEAPALAKPVLVTRQVTERPEALQAGVVKLVGDREEEIIRWSSLLLEDKEAYRSMAKGVSPYGDGKACERILNILTGSSFEEFKG